MKITLKLYATLGDLLPHGAQSNKVEIEVDSGTTPSHVIQRYNIPPSSAHLVLINGVFTCEADRDNTVLKAGDALAIWPPVAGG